MVSSSNPRFALNPARALDLPRIPPGPWIGLELSQGPRFALILAWALELSFEKEVYSVNCYVFKIIS